MKITLKDVYFSVLDEQGELKGELVEYKSAVDVTVQYEDELKLNYNSSYIYDEPKRKRVGVVRPKLNVVDLLFQGLYGECDFEGINSTALDKYFKVVRVPGWVYYKMNKGVTN